MSSSADAARDREAGLPPAPGLAGTIASAVRDVYVNSWRLVIANLAWGGAFIALYIVGLGALPLALLCAPLLGLPTISIYRLAALIARGVPVSLSDAFGTWRSLFRPAVVLAGGLSFTWLVLIANVVLGIANASLLGWAMATVAVWALVMTALVALAAWPLLADPWRDDLDLRARVRLATLLVLAHPVRLCLLGLVLGAILVGSTIVFAALLIISVAFVALVSSGYVLPAADRLEARLGGVVRRGPDAE